MVSYAQPTAPILPVAVGLDAEIQRLQLLLAAELPWLQLSYGKAYKASRQQNGKGKLLAYPEVYAGKGEYRDVLPNDNVVAQSFFYPTGPAINPDREPIPGTLGLTQACDLVVWVNLRKLDATKQYRFESELLLDVVRVLSEDGRVLVSRLITQPEDVLRGFALDLVPEVVLRHPYAGFRLSLELYVTNALCK